MRTVALFGSPDALPGSCGSWHVVQVCGCTSSIVGALMPGAGTGDTKP
jgi:hypothetical protein